MLFWDVTGTARSLIFLRGASRAASSVLLVWLASSSEKTATNGVKFCSHAASESKSSLRVLPHQFTRRAGAQRGSKMHALGVCSMCRVLGARVKKRVPKPRTALGRLCLRIPEREQRGGPPAAVAWRRPRITQRRNSHADTTLARAHAGH